MTSLLILSEESRSGNKKCYNGSEESEPKGWEEQYPGKELQKAGCELPLKGRQDSGTLRSVYFLSTPEPREYIQNLLPVSLSSLLRFPNYTIHATSTDLGITGQSFECRMYFRLPVLYYQEYFYSGKLSHGCSNHPQLKAQGKSHHLNNIRRVWRTLLRTQIVNLLRFLQKSVHLNPINE